MLDLLIRLEQMQQCCERVQSNPELTEREKTAAICFRNLVRECLPAAVLTTYDRMRKAQPRGLENPELFAMSVLVSTYSRLPAAGRRRLLSHFIPDRRPKAPRLTPARSGRRGRAYAL